MKKTCIRFLFILGFGVACQPGEQAASEPEIVPSASEAPAAAKAYTNPVYAADFADPTVIRAADGYYYVYGTNTEVKGETVNIQVARSKDMVTWEHVGDALPEKPVWAGKDFWAPHVLYDAINQMYYLYYSGESRSETEGKCLAVATSKSPSGPFADKGEPLLCGESFESIDPMAYDESATGKKLLYWGSAHLPIKVQELTEDRLSFKPGTKPTEVVQAIHNNDPANYQNLVEGAWVRFRDGYYYLFYSGDNCCGDKAHYAVMVTRSKNATGPFKTLAEATGRENSLILERNEQWIARGYNSIVTDDAGQDWIIYHAIDANKLNKGRVMLMDKIIYRDGWPQIETGTPSVSAQQAPVLK
ncbi:glycoside hydrolase family 43 protein [Pontibacter toksunensis]|uniref:Glycoside hydrolase family 43 protein n=1 Tax=Pontibacter toksunensis TaxID=1332631 RepID=A0ABW6C269_9BACT